MQHTPELYARQPSWLRFQKAQRWTDCPLLKSCDERKTIALTTSLANLVLTLIWSILPWNVNKCVRRVHAKKNSESRNSTTWFIQMEYRLFNHASSLCGDISRKLTVEPNFTTIAMNSYISQQIIPRRHWSSCNFWAQRHVAVSNLSARSEHNRTSVYDFASESCENSCSFLTQLY
jgi:hypothetical protein